MKMVRSRWKWDRLPRGAIAGSGPTLRAGVGAGTPGAEATAGLTPLGDLGGLRRNTIMSLVPHRHPLKAMCVAQGDTESPAQESALKLFKIRFADSEGHRRSASFLIERRYASRGYKVDALSSAKRSRLTFSAYDGDNVVATISVAQDSTNGLFVDALFGAELKSLRARGAKVCEFTKLAIDEAIRSKAVLAALFHVAYIQGHRIGACTDLVVEVNPRHVRFYERMLGFRVLGSAREDPRVQAPATLLHLDLGHAEAEIAKVGGRPELAAQVRSLYPFFLSPQGEASVERRLRAFA